MRSGTGDVTATAQSPQPRRTRQAQQESSRKRAPERRQSQQAEASAGLAEVAPGSETCHGSTMRPGHLVSLLGSIRTRREAAEQFLRHWHAPIALC